MTMAGALKEVPAIVFEKCTKNILKRGVLIAVLVHMYH